MAAGGPSKATDLFHNSEQIAHAFGVDHSRSCDAWKGYRPPVMVCGKCGGLRVLDRLADQGIAG